MVTYRQVGLGLVRAVRAMDREAKRAERQRLANAAAAYKQATLEAAADAAIKYRQAIEALTSAHRVEFRRRNWQASERLPQPQRRSVVEDAARAALASYRPSWFVKKFGLEQRKRSKLAARIEGARSSDDEAFRAQLANTERQNAEIDFVQKLLVGDPDAVGQALSRHSQLSQLASVLEGLEVLFTDDHRIIAMVDGQELEDMPMESVALLKSGKASIKSLSRTRVLELHRDNICAAGLRVALEFLQTLPIETIEVVVHCDLLDRGTGQIQSEPVLYLRCTAQAFAQVNTERAEPAALVEYLGGHSDWTKRDGFRPIRLDAFDVPTDRRAR